MPLAQWVCGEQSKVWGGHGWWWGGEGECDEQLP